MSSVLSTNVGLAILFYFTFPVESGLVRLRTHSFINTSSLSSFTPIHTRKPISQDAGTQLVKYGTGPLKLGNLELFKDRISKALAERSSLPAELAGPDKSQTNIAHTNTLDQFLQRNAGTMIMVAFYLIRIFRLLLMARIFLSTLIHINPYLPPFNIIYEMTDFYARFADKFPSVMGIRLIGEIPWLLLSAIEYFLISLVNQQ